MHSEAALKLERFLPYRLSLLSNRISASISRAYAERFTLSITEWRVMAVLARFPGLSSNEVAERTAIDKVAISRAVSNLLRHGRLQRETHGSDRRNRCSPSAPPAMPFVMRWCRAPRLTSRRCWPVWMMPNARHSIASSRN